VRELEQDYEGQAKFSVIAPTAASFDEIQAFGFADLRSGVVVFGKDREAKVKLPGHMFGRAEIEAGLKSVLKG